MWLDGFSSVLQSVPCCDGVHLSFAWHVVPRATQWPQRVAMAGWYVGREYLGLSKSNPSENDLELVIQFFSYYSIDID